MSIPVIRPADPHARVPDAIVSNPDVLQIDQNDPFFLVFYPRHRGNWAPQEIVAGEGIAEDETGVFWLPILQREPVIPGLNGQRTVRQGEPIERAYEPAHRLVVERGGIVLYPSEVGQYRVTRDCQHPITGVAGKFHMDAWSKPREHIPGERLGFDFDSNAERVWKLRLIREGYLPEPSPSMLDRNKAKLANRVMKKAALTGLSDDQRARLVAEAEARATVAADASLPGKPEKGERKPRTRA